MKHILKIRFCFLLLRFSSQENISQKIFKYIRLLLTFIYA